MATTSTATTITTTIIQARELRMEKSAEKWGPGGHTKPPVGVQGGSPLKLKLFNKNKT